MTIDIARQFFMWSTLVNYLLLSTWFLAFSLAHDRLFKLHGRWFSLSPQAFDGMHYAGMAIFKILIFVFNISPLLALLMVR